MASLAWRQILLGLGSALIPLLLGGQLWAQGQPAKPPAKPGEGAPAAKPGAPAPSVAAVKPNETVRPPPDPVVAIVEGHLIYLSDIGRAVPTLPENLRGMPFDTLYPVLLERVIDHQSLVAMARRKHLDDDQAVQRDIAAAADRILEGALLSREAVPHVTEAAIQQRYRERFAGKPATEETRARHILVSTEDEAKQIIDELNKGADFATLAKERSKDPDGANGGDLGFFRRDQVWPGFADAAFSLEPGKVSQTPIKNEFGWHVIKVEERRIVAPPSYSDVHDQLRDGLMQEAVQHVVDEARGEATIREFNLDGTPLGAVPDIRPEQPVTKPEARHQ
jgi:peptidyl-prolyl cis-trans isomerase C